MKLLLIFSILISPVFAEVSSGFKEKIGKSLDDNEEFKKAFVSYIEMYENLYKEDATLNLESFKPQYLKYVQSKRCLGFLSSVDLLNRVDKIFRDLDEGNRKKANHDKVQKLMDESYHIQASYKNLAVIDGYRDCSFKVSEETIKTKYATINPSSIAESKLPVEVKKTLLFKNNNLIQKALKILIDDQKEIYTNSKLTDKERVALANKLGNNLMCAMYFAPSDQMSSVMRLLFEAMEEMKSDPNYIKDVDEKISMNQLQQLKTFNPDYNKCTFTPDPTELEEFKKTKAAENKVVNETYSLFQKLLKKSHPKIIELVNKFESNITESVKDSDLSKKMFIDKFPKYLDQVDQSLSYSIYGMLKDKKCLSEVLKQVEKCSTDERYKVVNKHNNLLMSLCTQDYKEELKSSCKFDQ